MKTYCQCFSLRLRRALIIVAVCIFFYFVFATFESKSVESKLMTFFTPQNPKIVVYNRIPKSGSTSIVRIFEHLSLLNGFRVYRFAIYNPLGFLNPLLHKAFVDDVTSLSYRTNLFVHGHFFHINFHKHGVFHNYVYINILRDPLERLVSKYYFIRFGDDHRPETHRRGMTNDSTQFMTFDQCVKINGKDCDPKDLWLQVPFFCGSSAYCRIPGNYFALEAAKRRLIEEYLLVGVLDYFENFVELLSNLLPDYLKGIESTRHLKLNGFPLWHLRKTKSKSPILPETLDYFKKSPIWRMEQEFYEFAKTEFLSRYNYYKNKPFNQSEWRNSLFLRSV